MGIGLVVVDKAVAPNGDVDGSLFDPFARQMVFDCGILSEMGMFRQLLHYNRPVAKVSKPKPTLRPVRGQAQMRELGSNSNFFWVEFLVFYDQSKIREFGYVRREDRKEILDGVYQTLDDLGERGWVWTKRNGKWQVRWRKRWSR